MKGLHFKEEVLFIDNLAVIDLAREYSSPAFIYSSREIEENFSRYKEGAREQDLICYAVKANSNLSILKLLSDLGSGFDVVSGNELKKCLLAGADKNKIVFSGVAKTEEEIKLAIESEILSINIESVGELERIQEIAKELNKKVRCAFRVNPDISIGSHKYIETGSKNSKFGLSKESIREISVDTLKDPNLEIISLACHIGSQISDETLILKSLDCIIEIADELNGLGHNISHLDIGGGLGIQYRDEDTGNPSILLEETKKRLSDKSFKIIVEPGRSIVGTAGILLAKVEYIKQAGDRKFAIIDTGMNDLIRPSLYQAWHDVKPIEPRRTAIEKYDLAGPVCETGDILATERELKIVPGDFVAFMDVGAYGSVMTSNYNSRLKPIEILVTDDNAKVIRKRESFDDLIALET